MAAERGPVLAHCLAAMPNSDGSFRIQEPLGGMFFVELYLERLPLIEAADAARTCGFNAMQRRYRELCKALDARAYAEVHDRPSYHPLHQLAERAAAQRRSFSPPPPRIGRTTRPLSWRPGSNWPTVTASTRTSSFTLNTMIAGIAKRSAQLDRVGLAGQWVVTGSDAERLRAAFGKDGGPSPEGRRRAGPGGPLHERRTWRQPVDDDVTEDFKKLLGRVEDVIRDPGPDDPRETRVLCYYALLDAIESLPARRPAAANSAVCWTYAGPRRVGLWGALAASEPVHRRLPLLCAVSLSDPGAARRLGTAAEYDALAATAQRGAAATRQGRRRLVSTVSRAGSATR